MAKEEKYDLLAIKEMVSSFVAFSLENEKPDGFCFTISAPLSLFLSLQGIDNYISWKNDKAPVHYWITVENDIIIDSTITQFEQYKDCKIPLIMEKYKYYFEENGNTKEKDDEIKELFTRRKDYFKESKDSHLTEDQLNAQSKVIYLTEDQLNAQSKVIFKTAYLVSEEMDKMPPKEGSKLKQLLDTYFNHVGEIFRLQFEANKEFFESELPACVINFLKTR